LDSSHVQLGFIYRFGKAPHWSFWENNLLHKKRDEIGKQNK